MKLKLFFLFLIFGFCKSSGQQAATVKIIFIPVFNQQTFILNQTYLFGKSDSIKFSTLKFYISNLQLLQDEKVVYVEAKSFRLLDAEMENSFTLVLKPDTKIEFNKIKFNLGIDSITNVSGAMGGDLDPTKGMYWTWQSGYINFKLEGMSNACPARKNEFEFHLGGYQSPYYAMQTIALKVAKKDPIKINFDLNEFFKSIDIDKQNHVMSPNIEAVDFSVLLAKCFYIK